MQPMNYVTLTWNNSDHYLYFFPGDSAESRLALIRTSLNLQNSNFFFEEVNVDQRGPGTLHTVMELETGKKYVIKPDAALRYMARPTTLQIDSSYHKQKKCFIAVQVGTETKLESDTMGSCINLLIHAHWGITSTRGFEPRNPMWFITSFDLRVPVLHVRHLDYVPLEHAPHTEKHRANQSGAETSESSETNSAQQSPRAFFETTFDYWHNTRSLTVRVPEGFLNKVRNTNPKRAVNTELVEAHYLSMHRWQVEMCHYGSDGKLCSWEEMNSFDNDEIAIEAFSTKSKDFRVVWRVSDKQAPVTGNFVVMIMARVSGRKSLLCCDDSKCERVFAFHQIVELHLTIHAGVIVKCRQQAWCHKEHETGYLI